MREPIDARVKFAFLALVLSQAAHSIEEYVYRLYDVFAPARFISSVVSDDLAVGFAVVNGALILFGLWCYVARVRVGHRSAVGWIWLWVIIETINGIGHIALALTRGKYFPGMGTAPLLLGLSLYLATRLLFSNR